MRGVRFSGLLMGPYFCFACSACSLACSSFACFACSLACSSFSASSRCSASAFCTALATPAAIRCSSLFCSAHIAAACSFAFLCASATAFLCASATAAASGTLAIIGWVEGIRTLQLQSNYNFGAQNYTSEKESDSGTAATRSYTYRGQYNIPVLSIKLGSGGFSNSHV